MSARLASMILTLCTASTAFALGVGDPAPKLAGGKWVQGEPVAALEKGKVYVVEFWATWCGPCVASIPHVNQLQKRFADKGLVVIGQNVWEDNDKAVPAFVKRMGEKMTYRVALDDKTDHEDGAMATTWLKAAKQEGIPTAFVVDGQGKIAWIGHPMSGLDQVVEQVLAGTFDAKKAAEIQAKADAEAEKTSVLYEEIGTLLDEGKWKDALGKVDELEKLIPEDERSGLVQVRVTILASSDEPERINAFIKETAAKAGDDVELLNNLAWALVATPGLEKPDLDLAEKLATKANTLAKGEVAHVLDTLARVVFMQGQRKAIELQEKAVAVASDEEKEMLEGTLEQYQGGYLPAAEELDSGEGEEPPMVEEPEAQDV